MVTLFGILNIGARGIAAAQAGLNVTGNNISNVNTEGYSRQRLVQQTVDPIVLTNGSMGQGSEIITVERIRDALLEGQINNANSDKNYHEQLDLVLTRIQTILNDPLDTISETSNLASSIGLNNMLAQFFDAFNELSLTPEAPEVRAAAVESAETLAQTFSVISSNLHQLRTDLNDQVKLYVNEINSKTKEIALLNEKISTTEGGSQVKANDFRDRRDQLVSELSEIIPIHAIENPNGTISVSIVGQTIVDGVSQTPLVVELNRTDANFNLASIRVGEKGLYVIDDEIRKGKLGAILDARDRLVPTLQSDVDELARGVIYEANKIHSQSSGVEGYQSLTSHFDFPTGSDAVDTSITLDQIFNQTYRLSNNDISKQPFPIQNGEISIRVADGKNQTRDVFDVTINTSDSLYEVVERIDRSDGVVQTALSALRFDPVFASKAQAAYGAGVTELALPVSNLASAAGTPIAGTPGVYSFEIHLRNRAGGSVDSNTATPEIDPFTINIDNTMTLQDVAVAIQTAGGGALRAQLVPSESDPTVTVLRIEGIQTGSTISIQNDTSGLMTAFDFPLTDPSLPLLGGSVTDASTSFNGVSSDSFLGAGSPMFNTVFDGPPPNVIGEGTLNLVIINNVNQLVSKETITISAAGINTLDELATAIEAANSHLSVDITADNQFSITTSEGYSFFFQDDTTGLIEAMGFSEINGYGKIGDQAFQEGTFEIVVANESGKVTHIVEVPVKADPSINGGLLSLNDIVDQINRSSNEFGAPLQASIVPDPSDPTKNQLQIKAENGYEFTFRSDESLLLSALGFLDGPVLEQTGDNALLGAEKVVAIGDSIGALVRADFADNGDIVISTTSNNQMSFVGDSSYFLAAAGINVLFTGTNAYTMGVNEAIVDNPNLLAASSDGSMGNNDAALAMAELQDKKVLEGMTLNEFYRTIISSVGNESSRTRQLLRMSEEVLSELQVMWEQNSGVSLDEESINLIRYQQAFQAAARFINTVDELLDVVINQIGG